MKLYLVTFKETGSQFIVNQDTEEKALKSAINANRMIGEIDGTDLSDSSLYDIREVTWEILCQLFKLGGYWSETEDTIILEDD